MGDFMISSAGVLTFRSSPDFETPADANTDNTYMVVVEANDGTNTAMKAVTINVTNVDEDGTVSLSTQRPRVGTAITATLTDADGGVTGTTWQWAKATTMDGTYSNIAGATSDSYTPVEGDANMYLRATAMYTDGHGSGRSKSMMSANAVSTGPAFDADTATRSVDENTVAGENIGEPVMATDADDDTLTYALSGTDAASFDIDTGTGQLMTLAALDYETKATYSVTVAASDSGGLSASIDVMVMVTNVDEMGEVTLWAGMDALTMAPQVGDTITGAVMDPDGGVMVESWQWARTMDTANMNSWMDIEDASVAAYMVTADDTGYYLRVMATYTDAAGTDMAMEYSMPTMMVTMNAAPMFESETDTREVAENTVAGENIGEPVMATDADDDTLTYALSGTDAASFDIDTGTGQLMTLAALDYETKATYSVTVAASDSGGLSASIDVMVMVTNVDEMGEVTLWAGMDALTMAPQVGDTITGAVMDPDGGVMVESWQWARTMDTANMNSWMDIEDASVAAYMVTADDTGYYLRVMATYTDAAGTDMAMEYSMPTMMVTMNAAPMFESETDTREVAENTVAGENIGEPVMATDADDDTLTYALSGTDAASFDIDTGTGQLMTLAALDYETKATYSVTVAASDSGGLSDSIDVTITVTDVDEEEPADPVGRYDKNNNGRIDKDELVDGVFDYNVEQTLSKDELVELIFSYEIG